MPVYTNDARKFKFNVLIEVCEQCFKGDLKEEEVYALAKDLVSLGGQRYRCCVYKEREILRQRARLSMGLMASETAPFNPHQIVQVIEAACDGCTIKKIRVTDNCRKCMTKSCLGACNFGALSIGTNQAQIDYDKCRECGLCAKACPYNAIVVTERPCYSHCPVGAISWDESDIAVIDEEKCINCGQCEMACPFGAIEELSWVVDVISDLRSDRKVAAIVAPSIQGQFGAAPLGKIFTGIKKLGFDEVYEVATGADAIAYYEAKELEEHIKLGRPMTTSCCTAFVNMLRQHFPQQYIENKSTLVTPMMALARKLKSEDPKRRVVFIGPCVSKKQEAMEEGSAVDYVLTYEELFCMFEAKRIELRNMEESATDTPSNYGRNFAAVGGVSAAVVQAIKEMNETAVTSVIANGGKECRAQLELIRKGKFTANILEGMCCEGGCIGGPAVIDKSALVKGRMMKENMKNKDRKVLEAVRDNSFENIGLEVTK
ncbi:MAG: monomeric [Solobacterium sp.]|nr:monomeric [FeFe] hydrogenase [Solobacterium sp.]